jgi:hypothetical protein
MALVVPADLVSGRTCMMYVYYFVHLSGRPDKWALRLDRDGERLRELAFEAMVRMRTPSSDGIDTLRFGASRPLGRGFSFPIAWSAPGLFASLDGDMVMQPIGGDTTQLTLRGSYSPDHDGEDGETHRLVEAVIKGFLDSIPTHLA